MADLIAFATVIFCGILAAFSLCLGLPLFGRVQPRWLAIGAAWAALGIGGIFWIGGLI